MDRPKYVSDAIATSTDGLHVGTYGPFTLYSAYQPIFEQTPTGLRIAAYEGLVRPRRDGASVPPPELFASVDDCDRLFVECMCRALHLRNYIHATPAGGDLFINVNPAIYESVAVIEREFEFMFSILDRYGLSPSRLICELVEEDALSNEVLARLCTKFRDYGARIALDDFGTGSSTLERFRALRPDVTKVDGLMFRELCRSVGGRRMLKSIANTVLCAGAAILVEGIESPEHLAVAQDIGAAYFQGFGLARPQLLPNGFGASIGLDEQSPVRLTVAFG